jgi:hypothetical protein
VIFVDKLLSAKIRPANKHDCTVYNGHDHVRPQKLSRENFEDWPSAKIGPHEISRYAVFHSSGCSNQFVDKGIRINRGCTGHDFVVMSIVERHPLIIMYIESPGSIIKHMQVCMLGMIIKLEAKVKCLNFLFCS